MAKLAPRAVWILTVGLLPIFLTACGDEPVAQKTQVTPVRVAQVKLVAAEGADRYAAQVRPRIEADLGFRIAGKITERLVETGTRVVAGTTLARLDPIDLDLQVRANEAQLTSARAEASNARSDFERYAQLRRGEWSTQQEYDRRQATMKSAEAKVRELEAEVRVTRNSVTYATLVADGPGVISAVLAEPGQVVSIGQTVFKLARSGEMEVVAAMPEQRMGRVDRARMEVEFWSLPGVAVAGRVREIAPIADPTTRTFQIRVTLINPPPEVQLGMSATLVAHWSEDTPVAVLPAASLTKDGNDPAVWVVKPSGDAIERRRVQVGAFAGDTVVIVAGLTDGETVVSAGVHKLDSTMPVRIWAEPVR